MQQIGNSVTFVDAFGKERPALVTAVHGGGDTPGLNVVIVSDDVEKWDTYGRQIERETSVVHQSQQPARGNYWK